jgi:hypothetical protein
MSAEQALVFLRRRCKAAATGAAVDQEAKAKQDTREAELDAALAMTFPASDPVATDCQAAGARLPPH